jgi:hypothetical protein
MLKSLLLYSQTIVRLSLTSKRNIFIHDLTRYSGRKSLPNSEIDPPPERYQESLKAAVSWLLKSQDAMADNGFGSYHLTRGWSSSYPETSGYIIPTLLNYASRYSDEKALASSIAAADWLVSIQKPSGGWQGGRIDEDKPEIVFNTAQVIRGLLRAFNYSKKKKYLESLIKGCDWLCQVQHPEGFWKSFALMNEHRVYDSFVDAPLLEAYNLTGKKAYKDNALNNLGWIVREKQKSNGWFEDCDNTIKHNKRPILHTIAYTIDGLLDCGEILDNDDFIEAGQKPADLLLRNFLTEGRLYGRYDENWKGTEYFICTGGAQMAIAWLKLYRQTVEECYLEAAVKMLDLLISIQRREIREDDDTKGALPGSFPVWGKYEPFAFPNWANKFFADALMMYIDITNPRN